jgi:Tol biopolymer transport system component
MTLAAGTRLGPYEVTGPIGAGGMGEVYRAIDTSLKRQVALKVLPTDVAGDAERLARFRREAELLAALNHQNIAAIYGLVEGLGQGTPSAASAFALAMELVDGEDLSQRLASGAIPLDEALPIARQIADALQAAHEAGIIHRDLKPGNIKLRGDGTVKVLDFGLAKAMDAQGGSGAPGLGLQDSPTITTPAVTHAGVILGTAAYMSPEQARGKRVDKRSDIWAFGCVLYEMLTGRRAFDGETITDVLSAVVRSDPDWSQLPASTPTAVRRMLRRSLEKDPRRRLADIADARWDLDDAFTAEAGAPATAAGAGRRARPLMWMAVGALAAATAAVVIWRVLDARSPASVRATGTWAAATLALDRTDLTALADRFAVAPDGSAIVLVGSGGGLSIRKRSALEATPIPGVPADAFAPIFSPDGQSIAFATDGALMRIGVEGGTPVVLARGGNYFINLTWSADGYIRFPTKAWDAIQAVPATGGTVQTLTFPEDTRVSRAEALPGRRLLISLATDRALQIVVREPDGTDRVVAEGWDGRLSPTGHILFAQADGPSFSLAAVPFDVDVAAVTGEPVVLARDLAVQYATPAAATSSGDLFYLAGKPRSERRVVIVDRGGGERDAPLPQGAWVSVAPSPDGQSLALNRWEGARRSVWTVALATGALTQVTYGDDVFRPMWAADGRRLFVTYFPKSPGTQQTSMWSVVPDGRGELEPMPGGLDAYPLAMSTDGRMLYYEQYRTDQDQANILALDLRASDAEPIPLLETPASEEVPRPSPDGRWLAWSTDASGTNETRIAPLNDLTAVVQLSTRGGQPIGWSANGAEFFYRDGDTISVVDVTSRGPQLASRRVAFRLPGDLGGSPAVLPDGQHAVLIRGGLVYSDLVVAQGALATR